MPDSEVNAETRVTDEKEAAVRLTGRYISAGANIATRDVWQRIEELERDNERVRRELDPDSPSLVDVNERLREALEPFAAYAARMMSGLPDSVAVATLHDTSRGDLSVTRGDFLNARAALAETRVASGDPEKRKFYPGTPEHDAWLSETQENAE